MCKFCNMDELDNSVCLKHENFNIATEKDAGMLGLYLYNNYERNDPEIQADVWMFDRIIVDLNLPINYCPLCGKKLRG